MVKKEITITYQSVENDSELQPPQLQLLQAARSKAKQAYNPYSNFFVGSALLTNTGNVYQGFNIENAAYPVCICAERTALSAAIVAEPTAIITSIAVSTYKQDGANNKPASPCGVCRQFMAEIEFKQQQPMQVILGGQQGPIYIFSCVADFLPLGFNPTDL